MDMSLADPRGLVRESYAIEGITASECRSIFLDWALSLGPATDAAEAMRVLLAHYGLDRPDHPMSRVLTDGLATPPSPVRRGGRAARVARHGEQ
ncbi:hypothetical protein DEA8626_01600 [Defluviimonas aquaemixtae]|uniref:Uncharacterized protein n=1 Tax=Albidovulum aquaemixtae TaxID=1542388 RepID=A0A2R8B6C3_9RHOB|nr:hypothetical protein [Defluviimonas aquaemixtae]SPH18070.1 hypothetical protein DEA8626_01600 [Defluviimonas aquaemixtae]